MSEIVAPETGFELRTRRIVAAAIKEGKMICSVPRPGRHGDVIRAMATAGIPTPINGEQGFLTSDGLFVDRRHARKIAVFAQQIIRRIEAGGIHEELFSEDLW